MSGLFWPFAVAGWAKPRDKVAPPSQDTNMVDDALWECEKKIRAAMKFCGGLSAEDRERLAKIIAEMLAYRFRAGHDLPPTWTPQQVAKAIAAREASND